MRKHRLLSIAVSSVLAIGSITAYLPAMYDAAPIGMTSSAADYTTVREGMINYRVYSDHAEVVSITENKDADGNFIPAGDVVIPSEVDGVPVTIINSEALVLSQYINAKKLEINSLVMPDTITRLADSAFWDSEVKHITLSKNLKSVGKEAFANCRYLESLTIPDSLISFGDYALDGLESLESIEVGENNKKFCSVDGVMYSKDKTKLVKYPAKRAGKSFTVPDSVTSIEANAFEYCSVLESAVISDSVTEIGSHLFWHSPSIKNVKFSPNITTITGDAFFDAPALTSVEIPEGVEIIDSGAFGKCTSLKEVYLPASVRIIGDSAFRQCSSLEKITIENAKCQIDNESYTICTADGYFNGTIYGYPNSTAEQYADKYGCDFEPLSSTPSVAAMCELVRCSDGNGNSYYEIRECDKSISGDIVIDSQICGLPIKEIGSDTFSGCTKITSVVLPDTIVKIGEGAFSGCASLKSINIPDSVTYIGMGAFSGCDSLSALPFLAVCQLSKNKDTNGNYYYSIYQSDTNASGELVIPSESGGIPIKQIDSDAFRDCKKITAIILPDTIESIRENAFRNCSSLTSMNIPDSVKRIDDRAFYGCSSLEKITINNPDCRLGDWAGIVDEGSNCVICGHRGSTAEEYAKERGFTFEALEGDEPVTEPTTSDITTMSPDDMFDFCPIGDGSGNVMYYYLQYCKIEVSGDVVIPSTYKGLPVKRVEDTAFKNNKKITSITIPDSVEGGLPDNAFYGCTNLKSVTLSKNIKEIGYDAFNGCTSLESIVIPEGVTRIEGRAFEGCTSLKTVVLPDSLEYLGGQDTFSNCSSLEEITIPKNVTDFGRAFTNCTNLRSVTFLGDDTRIYGTGHIYNKQEDGKYVYDGVIRGNPGSPAFEFASKNGYRFETLDGSSPYLIYEVSNGEATLVECDSSAVGEIIIPSEYKGYPVTRVNRCSAEKITAVTVPASVKYIGCAFNNCTSLKSITILNPDCVIFDDPETICNDYSGGSYAFTGTIYGYEGSTAQSYYNKYKDYFYRLNSKFFALGEPATSGTELKKGDANGDDNVDMSDVVMVMQACLNPKKYGVDGTSPDRITADGEKAGDVDGKAGLTANDALMIQRYSLKLIDTL